VPIKNQPPTTAAAAEVRAKGKYVMFIDAAAFNPHDLCRDALPFEKGSDVTILPIRLQPGQTIFDAVALYEVDGPTPSTHLKVDVK